MTATDTLSTRVQRRRLLGRIATDVEAGANIITLSAPPGAGKTTTLEQWLGLRRECGDVVLALPSAHADAAGDLWPSLVTAIRSDAPPTEDPAIRRALSQVVHASAAGVPPRTTEPFQDVPSSIWILVDDAQEWSDRRALQQLSRVLSAAQPAMRVAIGARYTPHGLLSTLLLEGVAKEYRLADLVFDRDEARELLALEEVVLSDGDLDTLLRRTDGWAAGLRLAALALAHESDRPTFVRNFAGTDRTVGDYLVSEVLSRLPPDHMEVLLDVSAADRVNLDLARLLAGRPSAGALIQELVETNALVQPVHNDPDWYELHPLLRSYLRAESRRRDEARHRRHQAVATDWFERAGDVRRAIHHAVAATDWARVESLIATPCVRLVMTDGPQAMRDILRELPAWLQTQPSIAGAAALTAILDNNQAAADLDLAVVDAADEDAARRLAFRAIATLSSARTRPADRDAVADALGSLDLVPGDEPDLAILGRSLAAMALAMTGDLEAADRTARATAQIARSHGLDFLLFQTLSALCAVSAFGCDFVAVRGYAHEAIDLASRRGWDRHPRLAQFYGDLAAAEWQRCDEAMAAEYARAAADVADSDADPLSAAAARCIYDLTVAVPDTGLDLTAAGHLHAFNELWPLLPPPTVALNACFELMVSLRSHEMELAGAIVRRAEEIIPDAPDVHVLRAMRHLYQGHEAAARQDLEPVLDDELTCMTPWTSAIAWTVAAHLADEAGEPARAHDALLEALRLAEPGRLMRGLLDATPSARGLLLRNRGRFGRHETFVTDLLGFAEDRPHRLDGTGLVLTDREAEVLRDLPSMLSLREIADAHVVSINTVKSHLKSVYRKLGVTSRREAVTQARELGLV
ncbi:LuxR C-terminal-related transcriptional regulator [Jiangella alkaliphila]|uniref:LuxR family transcriptional regulator, maltose regulon positive regulatory protein n=1 Tax=Jiangella alkaliphila TaxID=419479 RepID=A0A1H2LDI6_9ACTN|nr:LuxR C-terminal-related transcriptional regulator [Jiangella alkaliphila]SDU78795.1 LuxR family transcriptional regulator, maltose regulon positive regulatory protein [Jiangella alkaliphila]